MSSGDTPSLPSAVAADAVEEASAELPPADGGLTCPVWVQFLDPTTRFPYFYNVETHQRLWSDPDPEGEVGCCQAVPADAGAAASTEVAAEVGEGAPGGGERADTTAAAGTAAAAAAGGAAATDRKDKSKAKRSVAQELKAERSAWWQRPARVQREWEPNRTQYTEGNEDFNVFYGKYETDRFNPKEREPASFRCDPDLDSGYTLVDLPNGERSVFCIFFAKGCCNKGHQCQYYHHIPSLDDCNLCDFAHDIFGRERFVCHRGDLDGVGSFNSESRTLYVGDLRFDRSLGNTIQVLEDEVREAFGVWGEIEELRLINTKAIAFVRYTHRAAAEFAKVAMASQKLGLSKCIRVRWASEDPNPKAKKQARIDRRDLVDEAVLRRAASLGLSEAEVATLQLSNQPRGFVGVTAPYPDTSAQYPQKAAGGPIGPISGVEAQEREEAAAAQAEEVARQAEAAENLGRMSALLARIDAMHSSGVIEEAEGL